MTSDLGECEKWLIFKESYLGLINPSTPYRDSRHSIIDRYVFLINVIENVQTVDTRQTMFQ